MPAAQPAQLGQGEGAARAGGPPRRHFTIAPGASTQAKAGYQWKTFDGVDMRDAPAPSPSVGMGALRAGSGMRTLAGMQPHNEVAHAGMRPVDTAMHAQDAVHAGSTAAYSRAAPARRPVSASATVQPHAHAHLADRAHGRVDAAHSSALGSGRPSLHSHPVHRGSTATLTSASHTHSSPGARSSMASVSSAQQPSQHSPISRNEGTSPLRGDSGGCSWRQSPVPTMLAEPALSVALSSPGYPAQRAGVTCVSATPRPFALCWQASAKSLQRFAL